MEIRQISWHVFVQDNAVQLTVKNLTGYCLDARISGSTPQKISRQQWSVRIFFLFFNAQFHDALAQTVCLVIGASQIIILQLYYFSESLFSICFISIIFLSGQSSWSTSVVGVLLDGSAYC